MLIEMSENDWATIRYIQGYCETINNLRSVEINTATAATASCSGNGFANNNPFDPNCSSIGSSTTSIQHDSITV